MYHEVEGGTEITIKHGYKVWIPPMPEKSAIHGFEKLKKDQKWERTLLPDYWEDRREEEIFKREEWEKMVKDGKIDRKKSHPFVDPVLEKFRRQEFARREEGFWFYNNGEPTYINGSHYYYLNWTRWDHVENDGYPIFYENQIHRFYFRELCETDPRSLGYLIIGPRGFGKSCEEISCIINRITKPPRKKWAAIQSMTEKDAQDVLFIKKVVPMYNDLPDFFKPINDHGTSPVSSLSFKRDRKTGKAAHKVKFDPEDELNNLLSWVGSKEKALDGETLQDIMQDEVGKTEDHIANVSVRTGVNRNSVFRNNRKIGIQRCTTTIEDMDSGGAACLELWDDSDPDKRTANGQTLSSLYKWLVITQECDRRFADDYGRIGPDREIPIEDIDDPDRNGVGKLSGKKMSLLEYHGNERKARMHDPIKLANWVRKHIMSEQDIRIKKGGASTFNQMIINNNRTELMLLKTPLWVRGNFHFEGKPFKSKVYFERDDHEGRWQVSLLLDPNDSNRFHYEEGLNGKKLLVPNNSLKFGAGVDPIKDVKTKNPRASKMSAHFKYKYDDKIDRGKPVEEWESCRYVARYHFRPDDSKDAFMDVAMGMLYFGCWANIEGNIGEFTGWLKSNGMDKFIMTAADFDEPSFESKKSLENSLVSTVEVQQAYISKIRTFIARHLHRRNALPFIETNDQLLDFEIEKVTFFDDVVSLGFCELGDDAIVIEQEVPETESSDWFPEFDISEDTPVLVENYDDEFWKDLM